MVVSLIFVHEAERAGMDRRRLARQAEKGLLHRVQSGVYVRAEDWTALQWWEQYPLRIEAFNRNSANIRVFARQSAAALWGIPFFGTHNDIHVLANEGANPRRRGGIRSHPNLEQDALYLHQGYRLTSRAQTVVDLAVSAPFEQAIAAADHVLRPDKQRGLPAITKAALLAVAERLGSRAKVNRVRRVIAFADPRSESVGESLSRAHMYLMGFPQPVLQYSVVDSSGEVIGISDFYWEDAGILGEYDGAVKYSRNKYLKGKLPQDALAAEKNREDAMRAMGRGMVRWLWRDVWESGADPSIGLARKLLKAGLVPDARRNPWGMESSR